MTTKSKKVARQEKKLLQTESRWLQKVLFGLKKAQVARGKLADLRGGDLPPLGADNEDGFVDLDALGDMISQRVEDVKEELHEPLIVGGRVKRKKATAAAG